MIRTQKLHNDRLAAWLLRGGLAFIFAYAGVSSLQHPLEWIGYLPHFLTQLLTATTLVKVFAIIELLLAVWLISGKFVKWAGALSALMLLGIVAFNSSQLIITFRDIGLAAMALALIFIEC
jgi:uncharacterized membrane protein YphA (DoxX/SURF4 family)